MQISHKHISFKVLLITLLCVITRSWMPCFATTPWGSGAVTPLSDTGTATVESSVEIGEFNSAHEGLESRYHIRIFNPNDSAFFDMINIYLNNTGSNDGLTSLTDADRFWSNFINPDSSALAGYGESITG